MPVTFCKFVPVTVELSNAVTFETFDAAKSFTLKIFPYELVINYNLEMSNQRKSFELFHVKTKYNEN
jgi:hypothetical protein